MLVNKGFSTQENCFFQICISKILSHDLGFAQRTSTSLVRGGLHFSKKDSDLGRAVCDHYHHLLSLSPSLLHRLAKLYLEVERFNFDSSCPISSI